MTKQKAVDIGKAIIRAMNQTIARGVTEAEADMIQKQALASLINIWFDCLPYHTRAMFYFDRERYMVAVGWYKP